MNISELTLSYIIWTLNITNTKLHFRPHFWATFCHLTSLEFPDRVKRIISSVSVKKELDSAVAIVNMLQFGWLEGQFSAGARDFTVLQKYSAWLWDSLTLVLNGCRGFFTLEVKCLGHEVDHWSLCSAKVRMNGAISSHVPSWCGQGQNNPPFFFYYTFSEVCRLALKHPPPPTSHLVVSGALFHSGRVC